MERDCVLNCYSFGMFSYADIYIFYLDLSFVFLIKEAHTLIKHTIYIYIRIIEAFCHKTCNIEKYESPQLHTSNEVPSAWTEIASPTFKW